MKRLLLLIVFLTATLCVSAQGPFSYFLKPVPVNSVRADGSSTEWYFKPTAQLTAIQFTYDKTEKLFKSSSFSSAGIGVGLKHYIEVDGKMVNNYGINALIIFDASQSSTGSVGAAITIEALRFINIGPGINLKDKQLFVLVGGVWTF